MVYKLSKFLMFLGMLTSSTGYSVQLCRKHVRQFSLMETALKVAEESALKVYSFLPRRLPSHSQLRAAKIVAHRGAHDSKNGILPNTKSAFDRALANGIWGIEFDVRWTRDQIPVIHHDSNTSQIHLIDMTISEHTASQLRETVPEVMHLEEAIQLYGQKMHLMVELKEEATPAQLKVLQDLFSTLVPEADFHLIAIDPTLLLNIEFFPRTTLLAVAETNTSIMSQATSDLHLGGLTGHFVLIHKSIIANHQGNGQKIGTGYVDANNILKREILRGVDWIFTNNAVEMQQSLDQMLKSLPVNLHSD